MRHVHDDVKDGVPEAAYGTDGVGVVSCLRFMATFQLQLMER